MKIFKTPKIIAKSFINIIGINVFKLQSGNINIQSITVSKYKNSINKVKIENVPKLLINLETNEL